MKVTNKKVEQLIAEGILFAPMDGNHGEKHPKTSDYVEKGVPFILVPDLVDGTVDLDNCNYISEEQAKTLRKGFSITGDVLFTHKATIGKVALVDTKGYEYIILTPQVTYYRVKDDKILCNEYLYYYFQSHTFQETFRLFASSGGTRDYLGIVAQQKLPIIYPDIDVQKDIVGVLKNFDNLIHNNNKRIRILEQMAENLYKEWFIRFRFPGYEDIEFDGGIPKDWKLKKVDEIGKVVAGGTPSTEIEEYWDGEIAWLTPADLADFDGVYIAKGNKNITELGLKKSSAKMMPKNTVLLSSRAPIGYVALSRNDICTNQGFKSVICDEECVTHQYLFYYFKMNKSLLEAYGSGATFLELSAGSLKKIKILVPSMDVQRGFSNIVNGFFEEIYSLSERNSSLKKQKDLLLPRLMSGKLAVK